MASLQYYAYPGFGEVGREKFHFSQAVRVADRIEISGQGGWNRDSMEIDPDLDRQIDQTFDNIDFNLRHAGGQGWSQVFKIITYSVDFDERHQDAIVRNLKKWMPDHMPIWTELGVHRLGLPGMKIEIEVAAYDPVKQ